MAAFDGQRRKFSTLDSIMWAMKGYMGNPSRAKRMAAPATSAKDMVPNSSSTVSQVSGAPGTIAFQIPSIRPSWLSRKYATEAALGQTPTPLSATTSRRSAEYKSEGATPENEVNWLSSTLVAIPMATPASNALPPASRISKPAWTVHGWPPATAWRVAMTLGRWGRVAAKVSDGKSVGAMARFPFVSFVQPLLAKSQITAISRARSALRCAKPAFRESVSSSI